MASAANRSAFWMIGIGIVVTDFVTKLLAVASLSRVPVRVVGDWLTLQIVYNPGAAFGIHVGEHSRWVFLVLALIALVVLGSMVRQTHPSQTVRLIALGLVCGGAVGNLIDRIRSPRGVVDFIDVGVGSLRWPTFNVADMAVTCGAILLAAILWREGQHESASAGERDSATAAS